MESVALQCYEDVRIFIQNGASNKHGQALEARENVKFSDVLQAHKSLFKLINNGKG